MRFADIQLLRYKLKGFEQLSLNQKLYIYHLSEATLWGRDITFDQFGKYNLEIRRVLEQAYIYLHRDDVYNSLTAEEKAETEQLTVYLKRVWFSNGIHNHYGCEKFVPEFSESFLRATVKTCGDNLSNTTSQQIDTICKAIFDPTYQPKRVNKADGQDLIQTSSCNYYDGVTQQEVEQFYAEMAQENCLEPPSYGLNSTLRKTANGTLKEDIWKIGGKYGKTIEKIVECLNNAAKYAENDKQRQVIALLVDYYTTGDLHTFDRYSIEWLKETEGMVDFINGFIEVYGDPLGIKASWEGIVEYKDLEACKRTQLICTNAQWFEDHSPVAQEFKKPVVKGVTANVICAAMLGGDEYPSTAIGINLPNADWIRAQYGSKSVTISNLTAAYDEASRNSGFLDEFAIDAETIAMVRQYGHDCDDLHTDLHECLGHGSGQLLPGTDPNALKNYSSTIEEARADLFGLYYIADQKLIELSLLHSPEAYKAQYYTYIMNGMLTQCVRIKLGNDIEEAHMRNRALIANWCYEQGKEDGVIELVEHDGKTYVRINDYERLRQLFAQLLAEIQRIKSEGDLEAARNLVETYAVHIDQTRHREILDRYATLNIAPYKGFLNPKMEIVTDNEGNPADIKVTYDENMVEQMLRYSKEYSVHSS